MFEKKNITNKYNELIKSRIIVNVYDFKFIQLKSINQIDAQCLIGRK